MRRSEIQQVIAETAQVIYQHAWETLDSDPDADFAESGMIADTLERVARILLSKVYREPHDREDMKTVIDRLAECEKAVIDRLVSAAADER